jgi:hypothetical protein
MKNLGWSHGPEEEIEDDDNGNPTSGGGGDNGNPTSGGGKP